MMVAMIMLMTLSAWDEVMAGCAAVFFESAALTRRSSGALTRNSKKFALMVLVCVCKH